jgi:hypothetical protein
MAERQEALDQPCEECGHPVADHTWSDWGPNSVCVERLPDENDGWYGVCPCVRREVLEVLDG